MYINTSNKSNIWCVFDGIPTFMFVGDAGYYVCLKRSCSTC